MKNEDEIVRFVKNKNYVMVNSNLGHGSFGKTVLLRDPYINELFVAKKYEPESEELKDEFFDSFINEIRLMYKLNHPNIVRIYNYYPYEQLKTGFIIMEYIQGISIGEYFKQYAPWSDLFTPDEAFAQLIDAFSYLEQNGVVHRDIRESNILIANNNVKVIDFGLGKLFKPIDNSEDSMAECINRSGLDLLPKEYFEGKYTNKTDMFYLAELFNRNLRENAISDCFSYQSIINKMMKYDSIERFSSFQEIKETIIKSDFYHLEISDKDKKIYQDFSNAIVNHLKWYTGQKKFVQDSDVFEKRLNNVIQDNCFENYIQNNSEFIRIIVDCEFAFYIEKDVDVDILKKFNSWFIKQTERSKQLVINNMINKLSTIIVHVDYEDVPF